ncbi:MAG: VWA domain-containing protein [Burkholderiaceae bacterium]
MSMIEFVRPWALLLLPLPLLAWYVLPARMSQSAILVPERVEQLFQRLRSPFDWQDVLSKIRIVFALTGWLCLVGAVAAPLTIGPPLQGASGRDLLIVLDLSASMLEKDVEMNGEKLPRIDAVKAIAGAFMRGREGDRIGLVVFADDPYLIAPLTYDVEAAESFLDEVGVGLPGRKTAIGDAISLSVQQLTQQPASSRVIILLSDGDSNAGVWAAPQAADLARRNGIRIHTIGFGAGTGGNTALAEASDLARIASQTGGRFFEADSSNGLQAVYDELDKIEPTVGQQLARPVERAWTNELVLIALLMWFLGTLIDWRSGEL